MPLSGTRLLFFQTGYIAVKFLLILGRLFFCRLEFLQGLLAAALCGFLLLGGGLRGVAGVELCPARLAGRKALGALLRAELRGGRLRRRCGLQRVRAGGEAVGRDADAEAVRRRLDRFLFRDILI